MRVTILQGIPGAGKSFLVASTGQAPRVVSADHFFIGADGSYNFDPEKLPQAHGACLREFAYYCEHPWGCSTLVVDNTGSTVAEVAPYYALAQAHGHRVRIVWLDCPPEVGAKRNVHGVSLETCRAMAARLSVFHLQMPPWWSRVIVSEKNREAFDWNKSGW